MAQPPPATQIHQSTFTRGSDARNHIARCQCGWGCSGTYNSVRTRAEIHRVTFGYENHAWTHPQRKAVMPTHSVAW